MRPWAVFAWFAVTGACAASFLLASPAAAQWTTPMALNNATLDPSFPSVAVSDSGAAIVSWIEDEHYEGKLVATYFDPALGWTTPERIDWTNTSGPGAPRVHIDDAGRATAIWIEWHGSNASYHSVFARTFAPGSGWGPVVEIYRAGLLWGLSSAISEESGDIFVATSPGLGYAISVQYSPSGGWEPAIDHSGFVYGGIGFLTVVADVGGNATLMWDDTTGTLGLNGTIYFCRYQRGSGWSAPAVIDGPWTGYGGLLAVVGGRTGHVVAFWFHDGAEHQDTYASWYVPGRGWDPPTNLSNDTAEFYFRSYALGPGSKLETMWPSDIGDSAMHHRTMDSSGQWGPQTNLSEPYVGHYEEVQLGLSDGGDLVSVFETVASIVAITRTSHGNWTAEINLTNGTAHVDSPRVAVSRSGLAIAAWIESFYMPHYVMVSFLAANDTEPPTIEVFAPLDGSTVDASNVTVTGWTEPGVSLTANDMAVFVAIDGTFSLSWNLSVGNNSMVLNATDRHGNQAQARITVVVPDPLVPLRSELDELFAQLDAIERALWGADENATALLDGVNQTRQEFLIILGAPQRRAELPALEGKVALQEQNISRVRENVSVTTAQLVTLRANVSELTALLSALGPRAAQEQQRAQQLGQRAAGASVSSNQTFVHLETALNQSQVLEAEVAAAIANPPAKEPASTPATTAPSGIEWAVVAVLAVGAVAALAVAMRRRTQNG